MLEPLMSDLFSSGGARYIGAHKYGRNTDVDSTTVPEDIWDGGGEYAGFLTAGKTPVLNYASTADNNGSSGAATIVVQGLSTSFVLQQETVTSTGSTATTCTNTYQRVFRAYVATVGAYGTNVGAITVLTSAASTTTLAIISSGAGQTQMAVFTTPASPASGWLLGYNASLGSTGDRMVFELQARPNNGAWRILDTFELDAGAQSAIQFRYPAGVPLTAQTDLRLRVTNSTANNATVSGGFDIVLRRE